MTNQPDLTVLRGSRPSGTAPHGEDCLDDLTLAAFTDGALEGESHQRALRHAADCHRCRQAVGEVARMIVDPQLAHVGPRKLRLRVPLGLVTAAAAAAVVLVAGLQWMPVRDAGHRSPITAAPAPVPLGPLSTVDAVDTFRWGAVAGADRYRVTLFGPDGEVRYDTEVAETSLVLPDSVTLPVGESTWWRVDARLGFDRWVASPLVEFTATGPRRE